VTRLNLHWTERSFAGGWQSRWQADVKTFPSLYPLADDLRSANSLVVDILDDAEKSKLSVTYGCSEGLWQATGVAAGGVGSTRAAHDKEADAVFVGGVPVEFVAVFRVVEAGVESAEIVVDEIVVGRQGNELLIELRNFGKT
jgi:hypothetical protein